MRIITILFILLLIWWFWPREKFAVCDCKKNVEVTDVKLNPFYYPYSATSCMYAIEDPSTMSNYPAYLEIQNLNAPDHVLLTN